MHCRLKEKTERGGGRKKKERKNRTRGSFLEHRRGRPLGWCFRDRSRIFSWGMGWRALCCSGLWMGCLEVWREEMRDRRERDGLMIIIQLFNILSIHLPNLLSLSLHPPREIPPEPPPPPRPLMTTRRKKRQALISTSRGVWKKGEGIAN